MSKTELNHEQTILFNIIKQRYNDNEWHNNCAIKTQEAIIHEESMSLQVIKRESIILGPIYIDLQFKSISNKISYPNNIILRSWIYYDLNNVTSLDIKIDKQNEKYTINYSNEPLYEYGYEEDQIDKVEESTLHSSFDSIINQYKNIFEQLKEYISNEKLIKKILKSLNNYFHLKKDSKIITKSSFSSSKNETQRLNDISLQYFIVKFEKEKLEASLCDKKEASQKIKI